MKKLLFLAVLGLFIVSCASDTENTMTVTGKVKGLKKGTLYLQKLPDSTLITVDSLEIKGDGSFIFRTELKSPEIFYLYLKKEDNNDVNDRITFFGEPGIITINTSWNTFDTHVDIQGSETNKKLVEYRKVMSQFNKKSLELMKGAISSGVPLDSLQMDSIQKQSSKNLQREYAYALNFALNNKNSYIAPYIALTEVGDANVKYLDSIYISLSPEVAASTYGMALQKHIAIRKANTGNQ